MSPSNKDLAEFALLGLRFNVLAPTSVAVCGDDLIAKSTIPEAWVINLALAATPDGIQDALRHVPGKSQEVLAVQLLVALVRRRWQSGRISIADVRAIGCSLHLESLLPMSEGEADWGISLECDWEAVSFQRATCSARLTRNSLPTRTSKRCFRPGFERYLATGSLCFASVVSTTRPRR